MPTLTLLVAVTTLGAAANPHLDTGRELVRGVKYAAALAALDKAAAQTDNSVDTMRELYELQGIAHASLKHANEATQAFTRLLAIFPEHKFTTQYAPRVMTAYLEARTRVNERGALQLEQRSAELSGDGATIVLALKSDFLGLARGVDVAVEGEGKPRRFPAGAEVRFEVKGATIAFTATVRGERGAALCVLGPVRLEKPAPPAPAPVAETPAPTAEPVHVAATGEPVVVSTTPQRSRAPVVAAVLFAVAALGSGGAAVVCGLQSSNARKGLLAADDMTAAGGVSMYTYPQATALDQSMRQNALLANVFIGVAAALGVAALISLIIGVMS